MSAITGPFREEFPQSNRSVQITIVHGNILEFDADVLAFKYAQDVYGPEADVVEALLGVGVQAASVYPSIGEYRYLKAPCDLHAPHVLLTGVSPLRMFNYGDIRRFGPSVLSTLKEVAPQTRHLAMTAHGIGYGLDASRAFVAQLNGYLDAWDNGHFPPSLQAITIVEINHRRYRQLREIMDGHFSATKKAAKVNTGWVYPSAFLRQAPAGSSFDNECHESARRDTQKTDAFLAHNSKDKVAVEYIAAKLKLCGIRPWLDSEQIPPGHMFQDAIQQAIDRANSAVIFIGPSGLGRWQLLELRRCISLFVEMQRPVIPVLLPGVTEIPADWSFLKEFNFVRFPSLDDLEGLRLLIWGITRKRPGECEEEKPADPEDVLE